MPDGIGLRDAGRIEKEKIKRMSWQQKIDYFKMYYMKSTIIILIFTVAVIAFGLNYLRSLRDVVISGIFVNVSASEECYSYVTDGYFEFIHGDDKKQRTNLTTDMRIEFSESSPSQENYANQMAILAQLTSKEVDYMLLDKNALYAFSKEGIYEDLTTVLTEKQISAWNEFIILAQDNEGNVVPAAIQLKDTFFSEKYRLNPDECYLVIIKNGRNKKNMSQFIEYLLDGEGGDITCCQPQNR